MTRLCRKVCQDIACILYIRIVWDIFGLVPNGGWDYWIHLPGALLCFGMCRGVFHLWWLIVFMIFVKRQTGSFGLLVMSVVSVFWI